MRKPTQLALFAAGRLADFGILGFAAVRERVGPVRAGSLRVASRMVNQLRAGRAVANFDEFAGCSVILACFPESRRLAAIEELSALDLDWRRTTVLLCNDWTSDCRHLDPLHRRGAAVGVLLELPGDVRPLYLLDGDVRAVREARKLLAGVPVTLIPLIPGSKLFLLAALQCAGPLLYSLLVAGMECLDHTGLHASVSRPLLQRSFYRTLRTHLNAGRKAPASLRQTWDSAGLHTQISPQLVAYLDRATALAGQFLSGR